MDDLVTVQELERQIYDVEGVRVQITEKQGSRLVRPYNYKPLPDGATVHDLETRIEKCLAPFIYIIKL